MTPSRPSAIASRSLEVEQLRRHNLGDIDVDDTRDAVPNVDPLADDVLLDLE